MADATYQPKVYRDSGGDRLNVVSGGALNIESGSTVVIAGNPNFSGNPRFSDVNTAATTDATAIGAGLTPLSATSGSTLTFLLSAPGAAGVDVFLVHGQAGSTNFSVSTTGGGQTIGSTFTTLAFTKNTYGTAYLRSRTTATWDVISIYGTNVALS